MRPGRPACCAASPTTMEAVYVKATGVAIADHPQSEGRGLVKKEENPAKEAFDGGAIA